MKTKQANEMSEATPKVTFDGCGINDTDKYASRLATFTERGRPYGDAIVRAVNCHEELLKALTELKERAAKDAEKYAQEGNEPIWAFIADAQDAIVKAEGK